MANLPYSPFRQIGDTYFLAGQIGLKDGQLISDDIKEQTTQAILNISNILNQNGLEMNDIVDVTAFITEQEDFTAFNEVYAVGFAQPYPARTTVTVKSLPYNAKVELKVIALKK